ncbi:MAG: SpoIIE family protein phosphatase [Verrucomicrobiae bacterium]
MSATLDFETLKTGSLLDALPDGVYITDRMRRILYWNAAAERITGWQRADVVGRSCSDNILVHMDKDEHPLCGEEYCPLHRSMETGCTSTAPVLVFAKSKDGPRIPVEVTVAPLRNSEGEAVAGIEVFRDMSATIDDLNRARVIQSLSVSSPLSPDDRLHIGTRYVPHDLVGGDFLRVEQIDGDHYAVLVADVMGHGMAAALYTMQLRSLWEENRPLLGSPPDFLSAWNRQLHELSNEDDHFATAVHLVANAADGTVKYALAGHEHPLLLQAGGQEMDSPKLHGPCLGLLPKADFPCNRAVMERGDRLLLFTDGAVEVDGEEGKELGRAGLVRMLAACGGEVNALAGIEQMLVRFNRNIRLEDDLTLVLLTRM